MLRVCIPNLRPCDKCGLKMWLKPVAVADLRLTTENGIKQKISTSSCDLVWLLLMCAVSSGCRGATDWQTTSTKINWQFLYAADVYLPPLYYAVRVCSCISHVVYKKCEQSLSGV